MRGEFPWHKQPEPMRGLTTVEAVKYLRDERSEDGDQDVPWIFVDGETCPYESLLSRVVSDPAKMRGEFLGWRWAIRADDEYPAFVSWSGTRAGKYTCWTGFMDVDGGGERRFTIFSFLSAHGTVGGMYMVRARRKEWVIEFFKAVEEHFKDSAVVTIRVSNAPDMEIPVDPERIYIPQVVSDDIYSQTDFFFSNPVAFRKYGLRHKRGFLFIGVPGTGKTMMTRNLVRHCAKRYGATAWSLQITRQVDEDVVRHAFSSARNNSPAIVILDDLDSLTTQSKVTRAGLLSQIDGIEPLEGVLIIGTSNNPGDLDPALVHRPSRFDRVWTFDLPDKALRRRFLADRLKASKAVTDMLAEGTTGWTFAYLNELYVAACCSAISRKGQVCDHDITVSYENLRRQFDAGKKNFPLPTHGPVNGFCDGKDGGLTNGGDDGSLSVK